MGSVASAVRVSLLAVVLSACADAGAAQRTFVSGSGSDANACTITAPCRGFARAMSQTDVGGEIVALDSAGYGAFTIDRSVSVIAPPGVYAGISVFAPFAGLTVDAPGAKVALRNLSINGQGGPIGVWMLNGAELHVEGCVISGVTTGLRAQSGSTTVIDTVIRDSGQAGVEIDDGAVSAHFDNVRVQNNVLAGIRVDQVNASVRVSIARSVVTDNGGTGIIATASGNTLSVVDIESTEITSNGWPDLVSPGVMIHVTDANSKVEMSISNALIARNRADGVFSYPSSGVAHVSVTDSTVTGNYGYGLTTSGAGGTMIASRNTVTRNGLGGLHNASGGTFYSRQDNRVQGNFGLGDASGTITALPGL